MVKTFEGHLSAQGLSLGIVVARFNSFITEKLLSGCLDAIRRHGGDEDALDIAWVPGALRSPWWPARWPKAASMTPSSASVPSSAARRLTSITSARKARKASPWSVQTGVPTIYGVITADTIEQAVERAGTKAGNKGWDAALSAIEMANLLKRLE